MMKASKQHTNSRTQIKQTKTIIQTWIDS